MAVDHSLGVTDTERSELVAVFSNSIAIGDAVAHLQAIVGPDVDHESFADVVRAGHEICEPHRRLRECIEVLNPDRFEYWPDGVKTEVLNIGRIVRSARTECIAYGDVALHFARSDLREAGVRGWKAITRNRHNAYLPWATTENGDATGKPSSNIQSVGEPAAAEPAGTPPDHDKPLELSISDRMATDAPAQPEGTADSPKGYLGGTRLADILGIDHSRRAAFFRQLARQRTDLGDESWHEVREPRPNSPRFLYLVDSEKLRTIASDYRKPKSV